jgi:queuine/archaeosine tRNA-ribosyltransferase
MAGMRKAIEEHTFEDFKKTFAAQRDGIRAEG